MLVLIASSMLYHECKKSPHGAGLQQESVMLNYIFGPVQRWARRYIIATVRSAYRSGELANPSGRCECVRSPR